MTPLSTVRASRRTIARPPEGPSRGHPTERRGVMTPGPTAAVPAPPATPVPHPAASAPPAGPACDGIGSGMTEPPRHLVQSSTKQAAGSVIGRIGSR